jgi:hypothetical protein
MPLFDSRHDNELDRLARAVLVAEVDGKMWDLSRPLESSCSLKLLKFEDQKGQYGERLLLLKRD